MQVTTKPEYLDRFRSTLAGLGIGKADRILLAVSGGPDSLALLILAAETMPGAIFAVTIDHQLRPESAAEATFVAMSCAELAVPHATLTPAVPITGNIQSAARVARYQLLEQTADDQNCTLIATAHHGDDQLETILMRLARGSGIDGMSAIRASNGRIIRPLLGFSKSELEEICLSAGIEPVRDPSNENEDYDRVAIRKWLGQSSHPFTIGNPDFTLRSLRGNAVFRWEFKPWSVLFVAWTHSRSGSDQSGDLDFGRDRSALFATQPDNIFLVKASWWYAR